MENLTEYGEQIMKYKETNSYFRKGISLSEAMKLVDVTPAEAFNELLAHTEVDTFNAFIDDVGDLPKYTGKQILDWLGYN